MEGKEPKAKLWNSTQVYGLAVICLLSGIGIGYLVRASFRDGDVKTPVGMPAVAHASSVKIPSGPLKQEADKRAEPLLAKLQKTPDDPVLLAEMGKIHYQMRQFSTAAKYYEDSARVKPDAVVLVKLGGAYHYGGDDTKAIDAWNRALRLDPNNPDALFNIGYVKWHAQGDRKAAIDAWQRLLKTSPNHPMRAQVEELLSRAKQHPETPMPRNE